MCSIEDTLDLRKEINSIKSNEGGGKFLRIEKAVS